MIVGDADDETLLFPLVHYARTTAELQVSTRVAALGWRLLCAAPHRPHVHALTAPIPRRLSVVVDHPPAPPRPPRPAQPKEYTGAGRGPVGSRHPRRDRSPRASARFSFASE
jgi:hypothetical protein